MKAWNGKWLGRGAILGGLMVPLAVQAGTIVGGSALLTSADESQLEAWLGQNNLVLTKVFTKTDGSTGSDFHAAVDGKGPTFTIVQATNGLGTSALVGGYNPQSWRSPSDLADQWNLSFTDAERTAFLFNLSSKTEYKQVLGDVNGYGGYYQTANDGYFGPIFGAGYDLSLPHDLTLGGLSVLNSYGANDGSNAGQSLIPGSGEAANFLSYGKMEVFTVSAVPEPVSYVMFGLGLGVLGLVRRRQRRAD